MKTRDIILYSLLFLACMAGTTLIVLKQLTGFSLFEDSPQAQTASKVERCNAMAKPNRAATNDPQLKALAEYEKVCDGAFADGMMVFTNMPISNENATAMADKMALRLKEFEANRVEPYLVVEPDSEWGLVDFHEFATGMYDPWLDTYFGRLKQQGVTAGSIGTWVPFPEPQQDFWNNNGDPDDFAHSVNRYFKILRKHYSQARTAILLDSQVGEDDTASQLVAYTRLIEPGLVDMAGLQGFPWHPTAEGDTREPVMSASQFAPAYLAEEVANSLNIKEVLINTGSYRHRKGPNGSDMSVPTADRQAILDSIVKEVVLLSNAGYKVTVNVFSENKLDVKEGVDWSYWETGSAADSGHAALFASFVRELKTEDARVTLYDAR